MAYVVVSLLHVARNRAKLVINCRKFAPFIVQVVKSCSIILKGHGTQLLVNLSLLTRFILELEAWKDPTDLLGLPVRI